MEFNFDEWAKLAKDNPEQFEKNHNAMIQEFLDSVEDEDRRRHLIQLQWKLDAIRSTCKTPYQAALKMNSLLMESFLKFNETLCALTGTKPTVSSIPLPAKSAKIYQLNSRSVSNDS